MVKSILLCDLFIFCHNLKTWLITEQYHILNDTVAFSKFSVSGHDQKKWQSDGWVLVEKETGRPEQVNDAATALHCHVVMHGAIACIVKSFHEPFKFPSYSC